MRSRLVLQVVCGVFFVATPFVVQAAVVTYGTYSWEQTNDPNNGVQLGVNDSATRSGVAFGPADNNNLSRTGDITNFIEGQAGASTSVGYLSRITQRKTSEAPAKLETTGTKAVNIPQSADVGTAAIHRGIQVGWNSGTNGFTNPVLVNGNSNGVNGAKDFVIWESGSTGQPDALMVRVRDAVSQAFTDWFYFAAQSSPVSSGGVLFAYAYDLSDFGLALGAQVDLIEMANMNSFDRIDATGVPMGSSYVAQGRVISYTSSPPAYSASSPGPDPGPLAVGYTNGFGNATYDPDPLYVSVLGTMQNLTAVPEPASIVAWTLLVGLGLVGYAKRSLWMKK